MLGSIFGDIVGSVYEFNPTQNYNFKLLTEESTFTDDTICTIAIADASLNNRSLVEALREWCNKYPTPMGSYGGSFGRWLKAKDPLPYFSYGNGAAMRVGAIGWIWNTDPEVLAMATYSAAVTHNHPDGIRGAQATALATYFARIGMAKDVLLERIERMFGYEIEDGSLDDYRGRFDETCMGTMPAAFLCLRDSHDYESAIRLAVSLGADADTLGAIVGGIADALYGMPYEYMNEVFRRLPDDMKKICNQFEKETQYGN